MIGVLLISREYLCYNNSNSRANSEKYMPIVHIHLLEGRDADTKREIAKEVTEALSRTANTPVENVKIVFNDMKLHDYAMGGELMQDIKNKK